MKYDKIIDSISPKIKFKTSKILLSNIKQGLKYIPNKTYITTIEHYENLLYSIKNQLKDYYEIQRNLKFDIEKLEKTEYKKLTKSQIELIISYDNSFEISNKQIQELKTKLYLIRGFLYHLYGDGRYEYLAY